jgi:predicted transcriptional regulator
VAQIRNPLVHGPTRPGEYPLVPSARLVREVEALRNRLTRPDQAIPAFERPVETLAPAESLAEVLKLIRKRNYSQFPVYDDGLTFRGLLTENGITRWLARHVATELSLIDLEEVSVKTVLREEEQPQYNCAFVTRGESVERIRQLFAERDMLEAVLISPNGKRNEKLLGIATRWDLLNRCQA